ncbi:hypothetical protein EV127DRAFT_487807 [Xylaria flabelliformis]|nr:hypothetical protein EV127DRAFT_487807 [Xylaria flabelliformis]KAI0854795.1 hypothetical protein F4860DRAFT_520480 [Xylaria cubensis]
MSSRESSYGSSYDSSVRQETFRSQKSRNHQGEQITRDAQGKRSVTTINHNARGYDKNAPTPDYRQSSSSYGYGK